MDEVDEVVGGETKCSPWTRSELSGLESMVTKFEGYVVYGNKFLKSIASQRVSKENWKGVNVAGGTVDGELAQSTSRIKATYVQEVELAKSVQILIKQLADRET